MLYLDVPASELFDEKTDRFIYTDDQTLRMEHSLISVSKWESRWCKPFFEDQKKTKEELLDYVRCMVVNPLKDPNVVLALGPTEINKIIEYINAPMTATKIYVYGENAKPKKKQKPMTSEEIYYLMFQNGIPIECEKWHINRLFMLLRVFSVKSQNKKLGKAESAKMQSTLNAQRRAMHHSKG